MNYIVLDRDGNPVAIFVRRREAELFIEIRQGRGYCLIALGEGKT